MKKLQQLALYECRYGGSRMHVQWLLDGDTIIQKRRTTKPFEYDADGNQLWTGWKKTLETYVGIWRYYHPTPILFVESVMYNPRNSFKTKYKIIERLA